MNALTRFDPSALNRALIGFDRLFDDVERRFANSPNTNYPPYNILKRDENSFEIEIAVAGFDREDVSIEVDQNQLRIVGRRQKDDESAEYLHRGLAARDFERVFTLAEHMEVGDAEMTNGILRVKLNRVIPEALKPRLIVIK